LLCRRIVSPPAVLPSRVQTALKLAALVALVGALAPAGAQAAFPGRNGVIAYQTRQSPGGTFDARQADGRGFRRIVAAGAVRDPAFSPLGRRLAYVRGGAVWVMQADGTGQRRLTFQGVPEAEPAWSPRGDALAFTAGRPGRRVIEAAGADGQGLRAVTARNGADDRSPAWSAAGRIAFTRRVRRGTDDLWVLDALGGRPRRLTSTRDDDDWPAWSPGGGWLAFARGRGSRRDLYLVKADGTRLRRLTRLATTLSSPAFSPDGRTITFARGPVGKRQLWTIRATGKRLKRLTRGRTDAAAPDWQPAPGDPIVDAAGDIACEPAPRSFPEGVTTTTTCAQYATSDLMLRRDLDAVFALGDLQNDATPRQDFPRSFVPSWGRLANIMRPVTGNHEYIDPGAAYYFDFFNGPGQFAGPVGRRDQGFYSFDLGAWHVVALDSECVDPRVDPTGSLCAPGSAQEQWLRADLAAHPNRCTLAMWHHPYFTSGTNAGRPLLHPIWQALYDYGVELVLNGHTHGYERFEPMDPLGGPDPARGVRELVVATGGASQGRFLSPQPGSEVRDNSTFGVLELRLHRASYSWKFLPVGPGSFTDAGSAACH